MNNKIPIIFLIVFVFAGLCIISAQVIRRKRKSVVETKIVLPAPASRGGMPLREALNKTASVRKFSAEPVTISDMSDVLWAAGGPKTDAVTSASMTAPSAGALYTLKYYLISARIDGLGTGLYRYIPVEHSLVMLSTDDLIEDISIAAHDQIFIKDAAAVIVITGEYGPVESVYKEKGKRYLHMDCGHSGQNIYLMAAAKGLDTVPVGAFDEKSMRIILQVSDEETPLYIFPVGRP